MFSTNSMITREMRSNQWSNNFCRGIGEEEGERAVERKITTMMMTKQENEAKMKWDRHH